MLPRGWFQDLAVAGRGPGCARAAARAAQRRSSRSTRRRWLMISTIRLDLDRLRMDTSTAPNHRRLGAAPDAPASRAADVRVAAAVDARRAARGRAAGVRHDRRHGRGGSRALAHQRLGRTARRPHLERRGRLVRGAGAGSARRNWLGGHLAAAGRGPRDPALHPRARLQGDTRAALALGAAAHARALLPGVRGMLRAGRAVLHAGRAHRPADAVGGGSADSLHRPGRDRLPGARDRLRAHRLSRGPRR